MSNRRKPRKTNGRPLPSSGKSLLILQRHSAYWLAEGAVERRFPVLVSADVWCRCARCSSKTRSHLKLR